VANQYLDTDYVDAYLGSAVRAALFTPSGGAYSSANFNTMAKAATAQIETALRNSGYQPPTATAGDCSAVEEYVRLATYGVFCELASTRPTKALKLPEKWEANPARMAYRAIIDGDANLDLTLIASDAIGGVRFSEQSDTISSTDGSRPHTFSRKNMSGY